MSKPDERDYGEEAPESETEPSHTEEARRLIEEYADDLREIIKFRPAIRAHWDEINALCQLNGIPFNATGERIQSGGMWCVFEFTWQLNAMQFWDRFEGRWMLGSEFHYRERPKDLPSMKQLQAGRSSIRGRREDKPAISMNIAATHTEPNQQA